MCLLVHATRCTHACMCGFIGALRFRLVESLSLVPAIGANTRTGRSMQVTTRIHRRSLLLPLAALPTVSNFCKSPYQCLEGHTSTDINTKVIDCLLVTTIAWNRVMLGASGHATLLHTHISTCCQDVDFHFFCTSFFVWCHVILHTDDASTCVADTPPHVDGPPCSAYMNSWIPPW